MASLFKYFRRRDTDSSVPPDDSVAADEVSEAIDIDSRPAAASRVLPLRGEPVDSLPPRFASNTRVGDAPRDAGVSADTGAAAEARPVQAPRPKLAPQPVSIEPRRVPIDLSEDGPFAQTMLLGEGGKLLGELLQQSGHLEAEQVEQILAYQREHRARFGEAAVALGFVKGPDVLWALSRQFGFDYTPVTSSVDAAAFSDDLVVAKYPFSQAAETIRDLRSELLTGVFAAEVSPRCALAVVSPDGGDGKSWLAANLAVSLSQLGAKTVIVDANLRSPRLHQLFGQENVRGGLSGILSRHQRAEVLRPTRALPNLFLLPAGAVPPNPLEILQGRRFVELMHKLRRKFTHVIVDTPPASAGADARLIAARCGASVLVARRNKSSIQSLNELSHLLSKGNAQFAGLVVNDI